MDFDEPSFSWANVVVYLYKKTQKRLEELLKLREEKIQRADTLHFEGSRMLEEADDLAVEVEEGSDFHFSLLEKFYLQTKLNPNWSCWLRDRQVKGRTAINDRENEENRLSNFCEEACCHFVPSLPRRVHWWAIPSCAYVVWPWVLRFLRQETS